MSCSMVLRCSIITWRRARVSGGTAGGASIDALGSVRGLSFAGREKSEGRRMGCKPVSRVISRLGLLSDPIGRGARNAYRCSSRASTPCATNWPSM
jgi:hypothetical protein